MLGIGTRGGQGAALSRSKAQLIAVLGAGGQIDKTTRQARNRCQLPAAEQTWRGLSRQMPNGRLKKGRINKNVTFPGKEGPIPV